MFAKSNGVPSCQAKLSAMFAISVIFANIGMFAIFAMFFSVERQAHGWLGTPLRGRSRSGPFTGMVGDPPGAVEAENSPFRARSGRSGDSCKLGNSGGADMRRSRKTSDGQLALGDPPVRRLNHQLDPADEADRKRARDRERALRARRRNAKAWWLK